VGGFSTVIPPKVINALANAIQNNNPGAMPSNYLLYVPAPYYAGQVSADQVAAFIDNAIRNYGLANPLAAFITNNPYNLWAPNAVGAFLSSLNMSQTSVALLLSYAGATQMAQALSNLSGNYTNVVNAFNVVSPTTGATVIGANMNASQASIILSHPIMSVTQAAMILSNAAMPATQAANILNVMALGTATNILINSVNYNLTQVAQELSLVSSSLLANIAINTNMSYTSLAALLSNSALVATAAQALLHSLADNNYYNKWVQAVTYNAPTSVTFSTNTVISTNVLIAQNITVASGVTVTCGTTTCFFVAQSFNNQGTIVNPNGAPGGPSLGGAGAGGNGGGGIVIVSITAALGTINVNGNPGGYAFGYDISGTGYTGSAGVFYVVSGVAVPLGGTGGFGTNGFNGAAGINGGGGGGSDGTTGGAPGGGAIVYSFASPNAMVTYISHGISDWLLLNILGKSPPSVTPLAYMYGSGGGGGAAFQGAQAGGGGGGGGGEVVIYGYDVVSGTVNAVGGSGNKGLSGCTNCYYGGGGGGGGGLVFILYGATSGSVTANLAGGAGGTGYGASGYNTPGTAGSAGSTGVLYIAQVTVNG
jgi:hypothetical protein